MTRPVVLSNGELHVGINKFGLVHDFYYPYVGFENHSAGKNLRHRVGVWVDGVISWLDDGKWEISFDYPYQALIGLTRATNTELGIALELEDAVDSEFSAFLRNIHIINLTDKSRDVRLFLHQAFVIGDSRSNTDTGQYLPHEHVVLHYRGRRAFVVNARQDADQYFDQFAVGLFEIENRDGTYKDAEDGELSGSPIEQGRADSTLRFKFELAGHDSRRVQYWIACGTSIREALYVNKQMKKQPITERFKLVSKWWHDWLTPARKTADKLEPAYRDSFLKSVMLIRSHIDKRGAVIASTDSSMLNYWRDAYGYCWPRDGAHVLWPLIRMGYKDEPYRFFDFCRRVLNSGGFLMHKYRADGAVGSSWHPYRQNGAEVYRPIQTDETALTLFVFSQFYHIQADSALLNEFYSSMVVPMADFLASYIDDSTSLPKPSYDLWEENFIVSTYTTAVTYSALLASADLADIRQDNDSAVKWRAVADDIRSQTKARLFDKERQALVKGLKPDDNYHLQPDTTIDLSSFYGAFMFGLCGIDDQEIQQTAKTIEKTFLTKAEQVGFPRYENDGYRRVDQNSLGNYWFVTSLWMAQYYLESGQVDKARRILDWTKDNMWQTGVLTEQIDTIKGDEQSVAPLSWSQAEYISTLLDTITE